MSIIPVIFFALVFGLGSVFSATGETVTQEAEPPAVSASPVVPGTPGTASSAQMPAKLVRSMFKYREPLPSCGTIARDSRGSEAWSCLQDAADSGTGAEMTQEFQTREGAPIRVYLRVSHGEMEIFTDNSEDSLRGYPAWTYEACLVPDDVRQECTGS